MSKVNEAVQAAMAHVELCEQRIVALHFAARGLTVDQRTPDVNAGLSALHLALVEQELSAYRNLFMWAAVGNESARKEAKRRAFKRFLGERKSIMQLLDVEGKYPGQWSGAEEEEFRAELAAVDAPKE